MHHYHGIESIEDFIEKSVKKVPDREGTPLKIEYD